MKLLGRLLVLCLAGATLAGCAYFSSSGKDTHYMRAQSVPPLNIPPGISSEKFHNLYPVSNQTYPEASKEVSLVPPGLNQN